MDLLQDAPNDAPPEDTEGAALSDNTEGAAPSDLAELSLVGRAERIFYRGQAPQPAPPMEPRIYPDGYVRRSPPQPYCVPEGYYRRLIRKAALYAIAAVLLAILLAALVKRKIIRF